MIYLAQIAAIAHEANRAYCRTQNDNTQARWENSPEWQKDSAIAGVRAIIDNPDMTCEDSHESWRDMKLNDGWSYGPVKDPDKKLHPCMVDYHELSEEQQAKDHLFGHVVRALIPFMDKETLDVIRHEEENGTQEVLDLTSEGSYAAHGSNVTTETGSDNPQEEPASEAEEVSPDQEGGEASSQAEADQPTSEGAGESTEPLESV